MEWNEDTEAPYLAPAAQPKEPKQPRKKKAKKEPAPEAAALPEDFAAALAAATLVREPSAPAGAVAAAAGEGAAAAAGLAGAPSMGAPSQGTVSGFGAEAGLGEAAAAEAQQLAPQDVQQPPAAVPAAAAQAKPKVKIRVGGGAPAQQAQQAQREPSRECAGLGAWGGALQKAAHGRARVIRSSSGKWGICVQKLAAHLLVHATVLSASLQVCQYPLAQIVPPCLPPHRSRLHPRPVLPRRGGRRGGGASEEQEARQRQRCVPCPANWLLSRFGLTLLQQERRCARGLPPLWAFGLPDRLLEDTRAAACLPCTLLLDYRPRFSPWGLAHAQQNTWRFLARRFLTAVLHMPLQTRITRPQMGRAVKTSTRVRPGPWFAARCSDIVSTAQDALVAGGMPHPRATHNSRRVQHWPPIS